jgi:hypothetical protein
MLEVPAALNDSKINFLNFLNCWADVVANRRAKGGKGD